MSIREAYDSWSEQYDTNLNKTRDLEAIALRATLTDIPFDSCLEIGCGTGKNTLWFITRAKHITAVDLSAQMLAKAKAKVTALSVDFQLADITHDWSFAKGNYDLVSFSLVLEHIEDLDAIFKKVVKIVNTGAHVYIGELHPFKQYSGGKARFETENGIQVVTCFNHHISEFTQLAGKYGFEIVDINEYFDNDQKITIPRILTILLKKS
ncbi:methyltransferase type 11 [Pedobacter lusitanus]|uniref:Methyltransferase type 11 n=1 Tax=Pedobacter lusitanus TaxID=1503925 RepID=A0A0D0G110_9SPHI|nr:class I SAM-dependent methyltransferase [Pedobacter lusitanus]KIO78484.1 methyltransferase type 11 [Pedobacter lusitanus]